MYNNECGDTYCREILFKIQKEMLNTGDGLR